ncbi:MAG: hemagglutinin repeat-containing protein [Ottowia sp.]|nr:hemagglutinin repeat-containing protein [Ottowia sp.]
MFAHRVLVEGDIQQATSQLEADLYKVSNTQAPVGNLSILVGAADIKNALTILTAEREAPSGWFPSGALDNLSWIDIRAGIFAQNIHLLSTTAGWVRSTGQLLAKRDAWIYARGNIDLGGTTIVGRHMNIDLRPLWWSETATFTHHAEAKLKVQEQLNIGRTCSLIYQHSCAEIRSEGTVVVKNIGSIHSELGSISVIADRFYNEALRMVPTQKSSARQREWQGMSARYITCKDATCDRWGGGYLVGTSKLYRDWRDTWHADDALLNVAPALIQAKHTLKIQADEGHNFGGILSANDIEIVSMDGSASTGKFKNEAISLYRYTYQQTGRNEYGCGWWDIACVFVNDAKIVSEHKYNADTATENIVSRHVFARVGGLITASNIVNITLADFTNKGSLYSPLSRFESEKITGSAVLVAPTGINGAQVNLDVKSLFNEGGALHAAGLLNLKVATTLKNYSGHFEGNKILIRAASIENDTLVIPYGNKENGMDAEADTARMIAKGGGIDITTSGDFSQRGGVLRSTASDITLQVGGNLRLGYTPLGFKRSEKHATGGVFEYEQSTKGVDQSELLMSRLESTQNISLTVAKNADLSGVDIVFGKKMALFARQGTLDIGDAIILAHPFQNTVAWTTELNIEARKIQMKKYIFSEQFLYSMNKLSYGFNGEVHSSMYDFVDHMYDNIDTGLVKKTMVQGGAQAHYQAAALVAGQATADTINLMMADTLGGSVGVGRTSQYANVSRVSKGHGVNFLGADKINIVTLSRAHDPVGANDINLQGVIIETLAHNGSITIQSAGRLYLGAAEGSVEENSDDDAKRLGLALQAAAHVASGGAGAGPDASYKSDRGRRVLTEKIYDNAKVLAARGSITLKSVYDFDLIGGNVWADRLSFNVGRHLNITSQQHSGADTIDKDDWGLSAGVAFNIKTGLVPMPQGGAKGGLGTSKTAYKHVLEQSGMVANHRVDGHVVGNATLTAGHIVSLSQAALSDNQIVTQPGGVLTIGGALVAHTLLDEQDSIGRYMGGGFGLAADLRPVVSLNLKEGDPDQGTVKYRATQRATISGIDVGSKAPADINRDAQHLREETQNDYIKSFDISVSVAVLSLGKTQKHTLACHRARRGTDGCGDNSALEKTPTRAEIGAMRSRLSLGNLPLVGFVRNGLGRMSAPQLGQHNADYTVRDVTEAATHFFGKTTGASPKISGYYEELDKRGFLDHPLTKANADILIAGENKVSTTGPNATLPDKVANVATPLRHTLAHVIASGAVVQNNRYNLNGEYQREHLLQQNSPFGVR